MRSPVRQQAMTPDDAKITTNHTAATGSGLSTNAPAASMPVTSAVTSSCCCELAWANHRMGSAAHTSASRLACTLACRIASGETIVRTRWRPRHQPTSAKTHSRYSSASQASMPDGTSSR